MPLYFKGKTVKCNAFRLKSLEMNELCETDKMHFLEKY